VLSRRVGRTLLKMRGHPTPANISTLAADRRNGRLQLKSASSPFPSVHRADLEGPQGVDLTRSPNHRGMTASCANETVGIYVKRLLPTLGRRSSWELDSASCLEDCAGLGRCELVHRYWDNLKERIDKNSELRSEFIQILHKMAILYGGVNMPVACGARVVACEVESSYLNDEEARLVHCITGIHIDRAASIIQAKSTGD
jgi:hypothetical protein